MHVSSNSKPRRWIVSWTLIVAALGCVSQGDRPVRSGAGRRVESVRTSAEWIARLDHPLLESVAIDPSDGFDPDEITLIAVASNPGLRTLRDSRGVAHAQVIAAGLLPNPTLSFQPYLPVAGETEGNRDGYSGQLSWSLTSLFTRDPRTKSARLAEERVRLDIVWAEWTVGMQAQGLAYQSILLAEAMEIHRANIRQLEDMLVRVRHAAETGSVTADQLANTEAALLQARTSNAITRRDIAITKAQLEGILGGMPDVADRLTGELQAPADLMSLSRDFLAKGLENRRPDLKAIRVAMRSQSEAYRAATRQAFPSLQLGLQVARDPGDFLAIGPTIQIGLPVLSRGQGARSAARAESTRLSDLYAERLNLARQNMAMAIADVQGSVETLSHLDESIRRQARVVELYAAARDRGATNIIVYYTARTTLVQLRLQRIRERTRLWQGLVRLRSESGYYRLDQFVGDSAGASDAP